MASQSLYRKWRSQTFSDLVGQEPVVRTLLHAVRDGRLAHAYLFCGPRGTGKTSMARLLAKAVNCANPHDGEPCNECLSCRQITEGRSPDVFEIDAASNNGVDDIRELRENVNFLSTGGRFKVYVVDEAHMLSTQAFNALLKTLEEPPPHVMFILATTEAHKLLPTIVSRCQRFDFRRFTRRVIVERLNHVAAGEEMVLDPAAAELLARAAQGGMRDAVSLLDQAMAFCGREITLAGVRGMLGLADAGAVRALVEHVAAQEAAAGLHLVNDLVAGGADLRQLNSQIAEYWRALVLARAGADVAAVMDCGSDEAAEYAEQASRFALEELTACARVFAANETPARGLPVPQLGLELSFLECLNIRQRGGAAQPAASAARPHEAVRPPAAQPSPSVGTSGGRPAQPTSVPPPARPATPTMPRPEATPAPPPASASMGDVEEVEELDLAALDAEPTVGMPATTPEPEVGMPGSADAPAVADETETAEMDGGTERDEDGASGASGDWLPFLRERWELVKKVCKQKKRTVAALLHSARPIMVADGNPLEIVLQADYQFHLDKLREPACRVDVEWALEQVLERPCHIRLVLAGSDGADASPGGAGPRGDGSGTGSGGAGNGPANAGPHPPTSANGNGRAPTAPAASDRNGHASSASSLASINGTGRAPGASRANGSNGANGSSGSVARLTPLPRLADVAPDQQHNGHNGNGHNGNGALHDATNGYPNGFVSINGGDPTAGFASAPDARELEALALADPLVQEFIKELPARLVEVRPLDPDTGR